MDDTSYFKVENGYHPDETYDSMCKVRGYWAMTPPDEYKPLTLCEHPHIPVHLLFVMTPKLVRVRANDMNVDKINILRKLRGFKLIHDAKFHSDDGLNTNWSLIFEAERSNFCIYGYGKETKLLPYSD